LRQPDIKQGFLLPKGESQQPGYETTYLLFIFVCLIYFYTFRLLSPITLNRAVMPYDDAVVNAGATPALTGEGASMLMPIFGGGIFRKPYLQY
jgi:hypothetical protein